MSDHLDEQHTINTDPREYTYPQSYNRQGSSLGERPRRRGTRRNLLLAFVFLIIVGTGVTFWGLVTPRQSAVLPIQTFHVTGHSRLIVSDTAGDIHIHPGATDSIVVQGTKYVRGLGANLDDITVNYQQQGDTVSVTSAESWNFMAEHGVHMDITVPATTDLQIANTSADAEVEQISGNIEAQTVSGNIKASNLNGPLHLSSTSGDIRLDNANGTMALSTISGGIDANTIQLQGPSSLTSTSGNITFTGSLDLHGSYRMEAVSGDIHLTLPANAALHLNTSTTSGEVKNEFGSTTVGSAPQPALTLQTTSGNITVHKQ
jgi:putative adhesin